MAHTQTWAYRIRWILLTAGVLCTLGGIWALFGCWPFEPGELTGGVVGTPLMLPIEDLVPWDALGFYINATVTLGLVLLMQWAFLLPRRGWLPRLAKKGRPMKLSLIVAACMAMFLTTGVAFAIMEINDSWEMFTTHGIYAIWAVMGVVWLIWTAIFFITYRASQDRYTWMTRVLRRLITGSFLEVFIATGVYAWNPQNEKQCHCARGSYTGLVFGWTVMLWAFGPSLILLFMREKYRKERGNNGMICFKCGYDLRGAMDKSNIVCPECGEAMVIG